MTLVTPLPLGFAGRAAGAHDRWCGRRLAEIVNREFPSGVDAVIVDQPTFVSALDNLSRRCLIYRGTDVHFEPRQARAVRNIGAIADGVVATSEVVLESILRRDPSIPTLVLTNGVDFDQFSSPSPSERSGAVYVGALDARFDWHAVQLLAEAFPEQTLRIAGPILADTPGLPSNVELLGRVPYEQVPELLASAKLGLLPLSTNESNAGRSPMKLFEYLAAGLFVVASETTTLRALSSPGVYLYSSDEGPAAAFSRALEQSGANTEGIEVARERDWINNSDQLLQFVTDIVGRKSAG
jgi:teichuronic acid biosynthesis glycosyltransferase TuaH